jgi:uncharacterized protein YjeT (DUF2065 family)
VLDGLFVTPAVTAIDEALASAHADGKVAVVGHAKIAAALAGKREVLVVGLAPRAAKKVPSALPDLSSVEDRSLAAVICVESEDAPLAAWARVVCDGGAVVLVDRGGAPEASKRALCAGLTELEQRHAGRVVVTSGLVTHL